MSTSHPVTRPYPWEHLYPEGVVWDVAMRTFTLPELLAEAVAAHGPNPALEFRDHRLTYAEFGREVARAAAGLRKIGIGPGDAVALYLPNTPYHPISFFAVLRAGARVVHLSPLDAPRVLAHKLKDSGARLLITTDMPGMFPVALRMLAEGHVDRVLVGEDAAWGTPPAAAEIPNDPKVLRYSEIVCDDPLPPSTLTPSDIALLQYTGGTTGLPRAAMLSHANLTAAVSIINAWNWGGERPFGVGDRVIGVLPLFHIYALTAVLLRSINAGAEILLRPRFDPMITLDDIEKKRATNFPGVPTMWIALAGVPGLEKRDFSSLRSAGSGGAPLPEEIALRIEELTGQRLGGGWGMTETSPVGAVTLPGVQFRAGMIGAPMPGIVMDIVALDDPSRVLPAGETGEIRIKGPNVTSGYWNRPEENKTAFVDGFFLTGDIGYMDETGCFFIVDRKKDMIISGGFNVYPAMIEEAVYSHPDVLECAVIGIPDPYRGQAAKVFVSLRPGAEPLTLDVLRAHLADRVGKHEMPTALEIRATLPKTPVGKLSRRELADEEKAKPSGE